MDAIRKPDIVISISRKLWECSIIQDQKLFK